MKCDWVFLKKDGSKIEATLDGSAPNLGDGKWHSEVGYVVRQIVFGSSNTVVIATEQ